MSDTITQPIKIDGYHAHVYSDAETRPRAERCGQRSPGH
jgi:aromatic ring-cleaving dioxygenase